MNKKDERLKKTTWKEFCAIQMRTQYILFVIFALTTLIFKHELISVSLMLLYILFAILTEKQYNKKTVLEGENT